MTLDQWVKKYPPGVTYSGQCAQYAGDLYAKVFGFSYIRGDGGEKAKKYINAYKGKGIIDATNAVKSTGVLKTGDMVSIKTGSSYGHVWIVLSDCTLDNPHGIDSNWSTTTDCKIREFKGKAAAGSRVTKPILGVARLEKEATGYEGNYSSSGTEPQKSVVKYYTLNGWKGKGTVKTDFSIIRWPKDTKTGFRGMKGDTIKFQGKTTDGKYYYGEIIGICDASVLGFVEASKVNKGTGKATGKKIKIKYGTSLSGSTGSGTTNGEWLDIVKTVHEADCAKNLTYSQSKTTSITINNKKYSHRPDCSGYVSCCVNVYKEDPTFMNESTSSIMTTNSKLKKAGFKRQAFKSGSLQAGDVCVRKGHTAIFMKKNSSGTLGWYDHGSTKGLNTKDIRYFNQSFTYIWRLE